MGEFKQNKIPFKLDRYVYLVICTVFVVFHGALIMNWTPLRRMMIKDGAYSWKCSSADTDWDDDGTCGAQRIAVTQVGNIGQTCMFVGSLFGGILSDQFGPKIVGTIGCLLFVLSYLFLAISSESVQLYLPYAIIGGFAAECSFFGVLSVPNLFPEYRGLILATLGSGRSLSMFYSMAQDAMVEPDGKMTMRQGQFVCMTISAIWTFVMVLILPSKPFLLESEYNARLALRGGRRGSADTDISSASTTPEERKAIRSHDFKEFVKQALSPFYIPWVFAFAILYARGTFYGLSIADQQPTAADAFTYISPLSFIPCPFLGFMADKLSMYSVLVLLNACGTIMTGCLMGGLNLAAQWIGVLLSCVVFSFLASQNYCLIQEQYTENVRGKLAGVAMCVGGLVGLINTPIYDWATNDVGFKKADGLYLGLSAVSWVLLGVMWFTRPVKGIRKARKERRLMEAHADGGKVEMTQSHGEHAAHEEKAHDAEPQESV